MGPVLLAASFDLRGVPRRLIILHQGSASTLGGPLPPACSTSLLSTPVPPGATLLLHIHSGVAMWPGGIPLGIPPLPLIQWVTVPPTLRSPLSDHAWGLIQRPLSLGFDKSLF